MSRSTNSNENNNHDQADFESSTEGFAVKNGLADRGDSGGNLNKKMVVGTSHHHHGKPGLKPLVKRYSPHSHHLFSDVTNNNKSNVVGNKTTNKYTVLVQKKNQSPNEAALDENQRLMLSLRRIKRRLLLEYVEKSRSSSREIVDEDGASIIAPNNIADRKESSRSATSFDWRDDRWSSSSSSSSRDEEEEDADGIGDRIVPE
jgi:hypothetical protein